MMIMKKKGIFFGLCICLIYGLLINTFWRPFAYANKINDFGFADIGNNLTFVPVVYLFNNLISCKYMISKYIDIWLIFIFLSSVEILSYFFPYLGTFDFKDILGLLIGAMLISFFVKNII